MCVCHFFYDDKAMGNHITLSQLDAAALVSNYPLDDEPVSQKALSQTLVGHSVIVVRRICSLVSNFISIGDFHPGAAADCRHAQPATPETVYSPTPVGRLALSCAEHSRQTASSYIYRPRRDDRLRLASDKSEKLISNQQPLGIEPGSPTW